MYQGRGAERGRLAKLGLLIALALAGQLVARWLAGRYVANLSAPAQGASIAVDSLLLLCAPFGFFLAPQLSLSTTPLIDGWMVGNAAAPQLNRALYRSMVLVVIGLAATVAVSMIPRAAIHTEGLTNPMPLPLATVLAIAATFREEVEFRLGLLTVLAWMLYKIMRANRSPSLWCANLAQAILFGAIHQVAGFTGRTSAMSLGGLVLEPRTISGFIFGYAYVSFGLETAIMTHALGDMSVFAMAALFARR